MKRNFGRAVLALGLVGMLAGCGQPGRPCGVGRSDRRRRRWPIGAAGNPLAGAAIGGAAGAIGGAVTSPRGEPGPADLALSARRRGVGAPALPAGASAPHGAAGRPAMGTRMAAWSATLVPIAVPRACRDA